MKLLPVILLSLAGVLVGCQSPEAASASGATIPCTCGEPEAAFDGCAHALCLSGEGNPDNPDCVCGPLDFSEQGGTR